MGTRPGVRTLSILTMAGAAATLAACGGGGAGGDAAPTPTTTAARTTAVAAAPAQDPAVLAAARRWVTALAKGDPGAICRASSAHIQRMQGGVCDDVRKNVPYEPARGLHGLRVSRVAGDVAFVRLSGDGGGPVTLNLVREHGRWGVDTVVGLQLPVVVGG